MEDSENNDEWEPDVDQKDRLPSELFTAIEALGDRGTQAEIMQARKRAIRTLLAMLDDAYSGEGARTYYDGVALEAWREGILPPKPQRGRTTPHRNEASSQKLARALRLARFRALKAERPEETAEGRAQIIADETDLEFETVWNELRRSRNVGNSQESDDEEWPDILDMWKEWKSRR